MPQLMTRRHTVARIFALALASGALVPACAPSAKPVRGEVVMRLAVPPEQAFPKVAGQQAAAHELVPDWAGKSAYALAPARAFTGGDVEKATLRRDGSGQYQMELVLSGPAAIRFGTFCSGHIGRMLAVEVNGRVVSVFRIADRIDSGRLIISGETSAATKEIYEAVVGAPAGPGQ